MEDLRVKVEVMGSSMTDEQFLIQVLNNLTNDYELQMTLMEKRIGSKTNPLSIDELKEDLNLSYERLSSKSASTRNDDYGEEKALFVTQFKGKCRNCGKLGHKSAQCKFNAVQGSLRRQGNHLQLLQEIRPPQISVLQTVEKEPESS